MKKKSYLRPDFLIAAMAMIIGLCTMVVYIYQARIMSRQLNTSVLPYLQLKFSQGVEGTLIGVENKGIGPAFIKSSKLCLDTMKFSEENLDEFFITLTGTSGSRHKRNLEGRVLSPGENVNLFHVSDPNFLAKVDSALQHHKIGLAVCYGSVHDEYWNLTTENGVQPCKSCEH